MHEQLVSRRSALTATAGGLLAGSAAVRPVQPAVATPVPAVQTRRIKPELANAMTRSVYDAVVALQVRIRVVLSIGVPSDVGLRLSMLLRMCCHDALTLSVSADPRHGLLA